MSDLELLALFGHQRCSQCGKNKLISRFSEHNGHLANHCNSCRASRTTGKDAIKSKKIIDAARSAPCKDCRKTYPIVCMDFDHLPKHTKLFNICAEWKARPHQEILTEIAKCEVVCSNCHRIRTHSRPHKRGFGSNQVSVVHPPTKDLPDAPAFVPRPFNKSAPRPNSRGPRTVTGIDLLGQTNIPSVPKIGVTLARIRQRVAKHYEFMRS